MRILLIVYHTFWTISGIAAGLPSVISGESIPIGPLLLGILSFVAFLGFLFKFANKIVLYTLSLVLNIYLLSLLIRAQIIKPFMGFMEGILIILIVILAVKTVKIIQESALVLKEKKANQ